ncbi:MAG: inositol monophosphatase family protein [Acidimicrobiales bacterium]
MRTAEAAGRLLRTFLLPGGSAASLKASAAHKSTPTDLVTAADRASEALITERLSQARPSDGLLAEEGSRQAGTTGLTWIVDPLDGTINFVYGLPVFGVSVACADAEGVFVAAVHDPMRGETFSALRGSGAWLNDQTLALDAGPSLDQALVGTGFGYASELRLKQAGLLVAVLPAVRDIRRAGAAAIDLCWVASGRLDAYYETGLAPWDRAGGGLVVVEAGGTIDERGDIIDGATTLLAAAPGLGAGLASLLVEAATKVGRDKSRDKSRDDR